MQRTDAATRRFYAAFYQWTVRSANPTRRCAGSALVAKRKQSTAHAQGAVGKSRKQPDDAKPFLGTTEQLKNESIQSTDDRPIGSLDVWDYAVREKSEKSVTVELSVPQWVLRVKDITKRAELHEVHLSTPFFQDEAGDDDLCAIYLSGEYSDVRAVWKSIHHTIGEKSPEGSTHSTFSLPGIAGNSSLQRVSSEGLVEKDFSLPDQFWQPIGRRGTTEYFQTRFGVHVDMLEEGGSLQYVRLRGSKKQVREVDGFLEDIRMRLLGTTISSNNIGTSVRKANIDRHGDLLSENLDLWQSVTRKQLDGKTEDEICLPERVWQEIERSGGSQNLRERFAIDVEPLEALENGQKRGISLKGDITHVDRAKSHLGNYRVNIPKLQSDSEYIKIYSAATGLNTTIDEGQLKESTKSREEINMDDSSNLQKFRAFYRPLTSGAIQESRDNRLEQQTAPEDAQVQASEDSTKIRVARLLVPQCLRKELKNSNESTIQRIKRYSNLKELRYRPTSGSEHYLQLIGTESAVARAQTAIQDHIKLDNERTGRKHASVEELALAPKHFHPPEAKHFARVKVPIADSHILNRHVRKDVAWKSDSQISRYHPINEEGGEVRFEGDKESVNFGVEALQDFVDTNRKTSGRVLSALEIVNMGLLATETATAPRARPTHFAWVRFARRVMENGDFAYAARAIREHSDGVEMRHCDLNKIDRVVKLLGDETAIQSGIRALQRFAAVVDKMNSGESDPGGEVLKMGMMKDFVDLEALKRELCPEDTVGSREQHNSVLDEKLQETGSQTRVAKAAAHREASATKHDVKASSGEKNAEKPEKRLPPSALGSDKPNPSADAKKVEQEPTQRVNQQLGNDMRSALRSITQPVALVTSFMPFSGGKTDQPKSSLARGVTVSSLCTVTLQPVPIISFNIKVPSRSWDAISGSGYLRAHLLRATPEGATAAHMFTLPYEQPHEPFVQLRERGAFTMMNPRTKSLQKPPHLKWRGNVHASVEAKVLPQKCIEVGDHVIVVAEVRNILFPEDNGSSDAGDLAYGMGAYRQLGSEVKPLDLNPRELGSAKVKQATAVTGTSKAESPAYETHKIAEPTEQSPSSIEELGPPSPIIDEESLRQVLEEPETVYSTKGLPSQTAADNPMLAEALNAVAGAYNGTAEPAATPEPHATSQARTQDHPAGSPSYDSTQTERPGSVLSAGGQARGTDGNIMGQIRKTSTWVNMIRRSYSTNPLDPPVAPISKKILKTTVADYLCQVQTHKKRYTKLIETQRGAERMEIDFKKRRHLSPEQVADLTNQAAVARRHVARELALRNASDLRALLDKGRVDTARTQWLESNLEQGQVAVLAEAKLLRSQLEGGQLRAQEFEKAKALLTTDYETIDAQLMRLRDFADDDDDGDDAAGDVDEDANGSHSEQTVEDVEVNEKAR